MRDRSVASVSLAPSSSRRAFADRGCRLYLLTNMRALASARSTFRGGELSFVLVSDSDMTVTRAQVAGFTGVTRAAVTQWSKRRDFPAPADGYSDRFNRDDVIAWLDGRSIPADSRKSDEAAGATYGDRVRRRMRPADRLAADVPIRALMELGPQVRGDASRSDYLYLLLCLAFLRLHDHDRWVQLISAVPPSGDPGDARRLLRSVAAAVDAALGFPEMARQPDAPPVRLRPLAFEPVRTVMKLADSFLPGDFGRLRAAIIQEACAQGDVFYTPASVTRTMVGLLAGHASQGDVSVHDPFARFGELAAEFVRGYADKAAVRVCIQHPYPAALRLAGMSLAAIGTPAELGMTSSPPPGGATFLLANPPFGQSRELIEWLDLCIASLAEDGSAAVLMPYGVGFDPGIQAHDARRRLVEQGAVRAVIALPAQMFQGSSVGVCVWLLRRPTGQAAPVQLVDARKLGRLSGTVSARVHVLDPEETARIAAAVAGSEYRPGFSVLAAPHEIRAHGYCLHPPEYQDRTLAPAAANEGRAELDTLFEDLGSTSYTAGGDAGWSRCRLADVCNIHAGVSPGSLRRAISGAETAREAVPVVHPRHLREGLIRAGNAPAADVAALEKHRLETGDVLWIRTGAMGQTAIVQRDESGWLPHTNLLRLRVTETAELDPRYLLAYLSQPAVQSRIRDRSVRSVTTSLSAATLGGLEIPLPPLAEQQRILSALQSFDDRTAGIERRLNAARAARTAFARHLTEGTIILTEGNISE